MEEREHPFAEQPTKRTKSSKLGKPLLIGLAVLSVVVVFFGGLLIARLVSPRSPIPAAIKSQLGFTAHTPSKLPSGYHFVPESFQHQEKVLIYRVSNGQNDLIFTEQAKPSGFDFLGFYKDQMSEAKTLSNTPYESVLGKAANGQTTILSIVTDKTWIIMNTVGNIDDSSAQLIAEHVGD